MKLGINDISDLKIGTVNLNEVRIGSNIVWQRGGAVFDPDYQAILDRATFLGYSLPSSTDQVVQNQFVLDLKANNIWIDLDVLYVFANGAASLFSTLNWKNPSLYQCTLFNSPTFVAKQGWDLAPTTSYISTNFNPATNGVRYTLNDACRFAYISRQVVSNLSYSLDGNSDGTISNNIRNLASGNHKINASVAAASLNMGNAGFKYIGRPNATTTTFYNGTGFTTQSVASTSVFSGPQFIGRASTAYSSMIASIYGMGDNLTDTKRIALEGLCKNYMIDIDGTVEPEYQAIIDRATTLGYALPSAYIQFLQNLMIKRLKEGGYWTKMDVLYNFYNDATTGDFARLNWINPNLYQATLSGTVAWTASTGFATTGTGFINTNWNPSTNGVKYTLNNAHFTVRTFITAGATALAGTTSGSGCSIFSASVTTHAINSTNALNTAVGLTSSGTRGFSRVDATNVRFHGMATTLADSYATRTQTSTAIPNENFLIGRSGSSYNSSTYEAFFAGESLTQTEWNLVNQILGSAVRS